MNKTEAKRIAETITNMEILAMFDNAKENIKDWSVVSVCNKGLSKGCAWNILASDFDLTHNYHVLAKTNMVREFGDYLPWYKKPTKTAKPTTNVVHHEPNFKNYEQKS